MCLLVVIAGMTGRLVWRAAHTETGLQMLALQWRDATLAMVAGKYTPVSEREPVDQAEFWLPEVDRVLTLHPDSAQLAAGAALVLDSPGTDYWNRYLRKFDTFPGGGTFPHLDSEGIQRAEDAFESRCRKQCLELAARATDLAPTNVDWWRLRAVLLWRKSFHSLDNNPRTEDWTDVLAECARHDPENALYDYLAADFYWNSSAEVEYADLDERLVVHDAELFERGNRCFEAGQRKRIFVVGDAGFPAVAAFLSNSTLPRAEHMSFVNSRPILLRQQLLLHETRNWLRSRAEAETSAGDVRSAFELHRQALHMVEQYTAASPSTAHDIIAPASARAATDAMNTLAQEHPDEFSPTELEEVAQLDERAEVDKLVLDEAGRDLAAANTQQAAGSISLNSATYIVLAFAVTALASLVTVLLLIGAVGIVLARWYKGRRPVDIGLPGHLVAFTVACAVSVTMFGLAPAEIIAHGIQAWTLTILLIVAPAVVLALLVWGFRAFRFSLRTALLATSAICVLLGLFAAVRDHVDSFNSMPFDLSIPARGWEALDAESLRNLVRPLGDWTWAAIQWTAYHGPYLAVAMWAGFVAVWLGIKMRRSQHTDDGPSITARDRIGTLSRGLGRPALVLAALTLVAYLALAPLVIDTIEREYQSQMAFAWRPADHWTKVERAVQRVRSDRATMDLLEDAASAAVSEPDDEGD